NRMHPVPADDPDPEMLRRLAAGIDDPAARGAVELLADTAALASRERRDVDAALFGRAPAAVVDVPMLRRDVHDLDGLQTVADHLTARAAASTS
ncbi:MAG: hypothetical protein ACI970_001325, partial [Myxococcota bacterium]